MKGIIDVLQEEVKQAFEKAGYDGKYAKVTISNRPIFVSTSAMVHLPWQRIQSTDSDGRQIVELLNE